MSREKTLRDLSTGKVHAVRVETVDSAHRTSSVEPELTATVVRAADSGPWSVVTDSGRSFEVSVTRQDGEIQVEVDHHRFVFSAAATGSGASQSARSSGRVEVKAPMPGKIVKLLVAAGDRVRAGQPVLLFEAMKMQNELRSPQEGTVVAIDVETGQAVESRERLYVVDLD